MRLRVMAMGLSVAVLGLGLALPRAAQQASTDWQKRFGVDPAELSPTGRNPYFDLTPGAVLVLEHGDVRLTITALAETKRIAGVETRVIEERETKGGAPIEVSRNYFAISTLTNSVFYFGEDVDMYDHGRVTGHEGSWHAGVNGAEFGLMMPGKIALGSRYYQELATGVALDRAALVSVTATVKTPAGTFTNCLKLEETTPLEPGVKEYKYYAAGVGLVQDGDLKLIRHSHPTAR